MINIDQQVDKETLSLREHLRNVYRTDDGLFELGKTLREYGVFDELTCDPGKIELYNFGIRKMQDLGMLDEESLLPLLRWMLTGVWKIPIGMKQSD